MLSRIKFQINIRPKQKRSSRRVFHNFGLFYCKQTASFEWLTTPELCCQSFLWMPTLPIDIKRITIDGGLPTIQRLFVPKFMVLLVVVWCTHVSASQRRKPNCWYRTKRTNFLHVYLWTMCVGASNDLKGKISWYFLGNMYNYFVCRQ